MAAPPPSVCESVCEWVNEKQNCKLFCLLRQKSAVYMESIYHSPFSQEEPVKTVAISSLALEEFCPCTLGIVQNSVFDS